MPNLRGQVSVTLKDKYTGIRDAVFDSVETCRVGEYFLSLLSFG